MYHAHILDQFVIKLYFLENETLNNKILFYIFDLFSHVL